VEGGCYRALRKTDASSSPPIARLPKAFSRGQAISPAAEWLLDNFPIVEEQIREIREDLPKSYYFELPETHHGRSCAATRVSIQ
jgi:cyclic beta-1,2-glucan synthetase